MTTQTTRRKLTGARVATMLGSAIIPNLGSNKLRINGQGNPYMREDTGTAIHIFNVNAFATQEDAAAAAALWKEGLKLEKAGDEDAATEKYREALNHQMSFSVLAENAPDFQSAFEVNCLVEIVKNSKGEERIGINRPRPVAVATSGTSAASLFVIEEEPAKTTSKANTRGTRKVA